MTKARRGELARQAVKPIVALSFTMQRSFYASDLASQNNFFGKFYRLYAIFLGGSD